MPAQPNRGAKSTPSEKKNPGPIYSGDHQVRSFSWGGPEEENLNNTFSFMMRM